MLSLPRSAVILGVEYVYLEISDTGPQSGQANRQEEGNMRRERGEKKGDGGGEREQRTWS